MSDTQVHDTGAFRVLAGASAALDEIAQRLISVHDHWRTSGATPADIAWVEGLIADVGWWSGRLLAEMDRAAARSSG